MLGKKCKNCGEKISNKYKYCPHCSTQLNSNQDWGMLGKDDFMPSIDEVKFPRGFNMIFNSLLKNLNKQFGELDNGMEKERIELNKPRIKKGGLSISISTSGNNPPEIKVRSLGNEPKFKRQEEKIKKQIKEIPSKSLSQKNLKKISKLPKEEPKTNIRRLADKVIYEIDMPKVKSIKDVSIVRLENSIEIKALTKDKAYVKLIPINLPISDYKLSKGKLVLELEARG